MFLLSIRISEKILKFDNNKKEFHESKQPIHLVVSDKFKHSDGGFKYFTGYKEGKIVKPLCIILPQMTGYIKLSIKFHMTPVYDEKYIKSK